MLPIHSVESLAQVDRVKISQWINQLSSPKSREKRKALLELSKKRESVPELAPMLWPSCGPVAALLYVIIIMRVSLRR
uniref:CCR4-NOT transcription complex subunit 9 n=1 Tax=Echeneis naucrates TaxID=173247 RepID=A0A665UFN2_ECHNA